MKNLKLRTIGTIISVFLVLSTAAIVGSSLMTLSQVQKAGGAWHEFEAGPARKSAYLNGVYKALGFGGMLHQYKDYLLNKERIQIVKFFGKIREIRVALDAYKAIGINDTEEKALEDILGVISKYAIAIQDAEQMVKNSATSDEIAREIIIDDAPAIAGIDTLFAEIDKSHTRSAIEVNTAEAAANLLSKTSSIVISLILIALLALTVWFTRWRLGPPLQLLGETMTQLARGDTTVEVPAQDKKDEIGEMARRVQVFKDSMLANEEMAAQQREEDERKELRRVALENIAGRFEGDIANVLDELTRMSKLLDNTSSVMTNIAEDASNKASNITTSAQDASSNVQTVASAAEELSSSIQEIARQVSQSTTTASSAVNEVQQANDKVQGLAAAARSIGDVVALITDIADQTNLLALNATIEAARAGDAGKGFAVVASEVKNLANQTTKATEDITAQINSIQHATNDAVQAIESIGGTISNINEITSAIAAAVEEQGAATQEIARNVEMASERTSAVNTDITGVTYSVDETGKAAGEVRNAVNALGGHSNDLKNVVETFLSDVKSA